MAIKFIQTAFGPEKLRLTEDMYNKMTEDEKKDLELIEDDDDSLEAYNILFGKLNKNKLEKRYIDLIFFLLASGDRSKIQLGRSALNNAEEELQKKMVKKNRVLYLKFVSTMADKTGIKQKVLLVSLCWF